MVEPKVDGAANALHPWAGLVAGLGLLLPYGVIVFGWTLAPAAICEQHNPDGDRASDRVMAAVAGSAVVGVLTALPWAGSRLRLTIWWVGAVVALLAQVVAVFAFNLWYYLSIGGAFP